MSLLGDLEAERKLEERLDNLIALVLDAKACKARLLELKTEQDKLTALIAEHNAIVKRAEKASKDAGEHHAQASEKLTVANEALARAAKQAATNADRAAALDERERGLVQMQAEAKMMMNNAGRIETDVKAREESLANKARSHEKAVAEHAAMVKAFNEKKARLLELGT